MPTKLLALLRPALLVQEWSQLFHHAQIIEVGPVFDDLASLYAAYNNSGGLHPLASGSNAFQLPLVGAAKPHTGCHLLSFGYQVLYSDLQVGKGFAVIGGSLLGGFYAPYVLGVGGVVADVVWSVDLICCVQVSLGKYLFLLPTNYGLVLFFRHIAVTPFPCRDF